MPKAELPTSFKGWLVALGGSVVGFLAGFIATNWLSKVVK